MDQLFARSYARLGAFYPGGQLPSALVARLKNSIFLLFRTRVPRVQTQERFGAFHCVGTTVEEATKNSVQATVETVLWQQSWRWLASWAFLRERYTGFSKAGLPEWQCSLPLWQRGFGEIERDRSNLLNLR
jgi:hypothetical protein